MSVGMKIKIVFLRISSSKVDWFTPNKDHFTNGNASFFVIFVRNYARRLHVAVAAWPCTCYWTRTTQWYLAGFAAVAQASRTETCWLQTSMFCLLIFVWPRTSIPCRQHTFGLRRSSTVATLFHQQIVCRSMHTQHIWRQELRCRQARCLEVFRPRRGHYMRQFQAWTQNVFVVMLLLGRNATCVNCAIQIPLLTFSVQLTWHQTVFKSEVTSESNH